MFYLSNYNHTHIHIHTHIHTYIYTLPQTHTQGIGLNAQGFANAILFCAFTKQVRNQLLSSTKMRWSYLSLWCKRKFERNYFEISYSAQFESVKVLRKNNGQPYGTVYDYNHARMYYDITES